MIPEEVENRIARYFFHTSMPEELLLEIEEYLLCHCLYAEEEDLEINFLVAEAVTILRERLDGKKLE